MIFIAVNSPVIRAVVDVSCLWLVCLFQTANPSKHEGVNMMHIDNCEVGSPSWSQADVVS